MEQLVRTEERRSGSMRLSSKHSSAEEPVVPLSTANRVMSSTACRTLVSLRGRDSELYKVARQQRDFLRTFQQSRQFGAHDGVSAHITVHFFGLFRGMGADHEAQTPFAHVPFFGIGI